MTVMLTHGPLKSATSGQALREEVQTFVSREHFRIEDLDAAMQSAMQFANASNTF
jgi:hypothetical protein